MNRPTMSLLAAGAALAVVTGIASLGSGADGSAAAGRTASAPVERSSLVCPPAAFGATSATTVYTAFTPPAEGAAGDRLPGSAALRPVAEHTPGSAREDDEESEDPEDQDTDEEDTEEEDTEDEEDTEEGQEEDPDHVVPLEELGSPVSVSTKDTGAPALAGTAEHRFAPGWNVQQTTLVPRGDGRGLLGTGCTAPDSEFWFAGASTVDSRHDYLHLTNPDDAATVVDIELYGPEGRLESLNDGEGITLPGESTVPVRLSTLTEEPETNLAVRVMARTGRIGAQVEATDEQLGTDWLDPAAAPSAHEGPLVLPGIPADAETVRLVALAPGDEDVNLAIGLAGPGGTITPAGNESLYLQAGILHSVDLGDLTLGEAGSLVLTPPVDAGPVPLVAGLRVTRGQGDEQEMAFIPATAPVEERAGVTGNTVKGTELFLTAPDEAAEVRVTVSAGTEGGQEVTGTYTVEARTTLALSPELDDDTEGLYALTVERTGGGVLHAARMLSRTRDDVPMFTIQTLPDDRSAVTVPETGQDFSLLVR
ncbi:DUF5719 family protein [Streptomyces sp. ACA25]|uniref:DUF5719 family protein n=1 Tax=Streptomyces sp. ACA25 TaxID=3022596 RepID=UPI002307705B|nr:DUF5719 family protein [Streptomyces sp. ACA25]MDB1087159.1 DUF5719 family protein [Streptomyces sp. ACA25]